jgi:hypothetical protein
VCPTLVDLNESLPEYDPGATQRTYAFNGTIKGLGREFPVVVDKNSWGGGDLGSSDVYAFRNGRIVLLASAAHLGCPTATVPWRVTGTPDAIEIVADPERAEDPSRYEAICENSAPCVVDHRGWNPTKAEYE